MLNILRNFDSVDKKVSECPPEMPQQDMAQGMPNSINIQIDDANEMAKILMALSAVKQEPVMPTEDEAIEEYENEPEEHYDDHLKMLKQLSGGINREKKSYARAEPGDNPMSVESIKDRLMLALEEKQKGVDGKACWKGYKRMGTKKKGGKTVDNCVKM